MAYEPTTWAAGDVVTSAKLNNIEQGVANSGDVFAVPFVFAGSTATTTASFADAWAAHNAGHEVIAVVYAGVRPYGQAKCAPMSGNPQVMLASISDFSIGDGEVNLSVMSINWQSSGAVSVTMKTAKVTPTT